MAAPDRQTQRIQRDLQALSEKPLPFVNKLELNVSDEKLNQLSGIMIGPDNTPYVGGHFCFTITFPHEYPFRPPEFVFRTPILHPNVHSTTGVACHDQLLATWAPTITLSKLLTEMHSILAEPNYDAPIEGDPVEDKSLEKARQQTQECALPL